MPTEESPTTKAAPLPEIAPDPANGAPPPKATGGEAASAAGEESQAPKAKELAEFKRNQARLAGRERALAEREKSWTTKEKERAEADAKRDKELAELRAQLDRFTKGNVLDAAAQHGIDISKHVQEYAEKSAPERQIVALMQEIAELRDQVTKTPQLVKEREEAIRKELADERHGHMERAESEERRNFSQKLRSEGAKYLHVNRECDDDALDAALREIQEWYRTTGHKARNGKSMTFEEVASYLDKRWKPISELREQRRASLLGASAPPGQDSQKRPPGNGRQQRPEASTPPKPRTARVLTPEDAQAQDLQDLREAIAKDRQNKAKEDGVASRK